VHAWAFPLAAWNFSSPKSLTLFLAWTENPCKEHPTYLPISAINGWWQKQLFEVLQPRIADYVQRTLLWSLTFLSPLTTIGRLHKRILQSVFVVYRVVVQTNIAKCIWPFLSGALLLSLTKILWTTLVHRYIYAPGTCNKRERKEQGEWWWHRNKGRKEGRKENYWIMLWINNPPLAFGMTTTTIGGLGTIPFHTCFSHTHTHTHTLWCGDGRV
jgi:hypothetical protein